MTSAFLVGYCVVLVGHCAVLVGAVVEFQTMCESFIAKIELTRTNTVGVKSLLVNLASLGPTLASLII